MESVFLKLLNMSITAGWMILAVIVLRLLLRKAPKWISCLLWALVAVRLMSYIPALVGVKTMRSPSPIIARWPFATLHESVVGP